LPRVKYGAWGFALSLGTSRDRLRFGAAAASLRAACLRRSFSTARDHVEFLAVAAISAGWRPLSVAVSRGSALGWARTSMTRSSGCVVATLAEMGSAPNTSRCATCGQVGHLKICRSIEGAQRRGSPTITCIRRISAPHAAHRMTRTPQPTPAPRALRPTLPSNLGGLSAVPVLVHPAARRRIKAAPRSEAGAQVARPLSRRRVRAAPRCPVCRYAIIKRYCERA
jgi:hypothetical protein